MTTIDFYTHCSDRLGVVLRLLQKAWRQHGSVRVLTQDEAATVELGRELWVRAPISFMPHCKLRSTLAEETPIIVDHALDHQGPAAVLVNLHASPPPFFSRFERLIEVIAADEQGAAEGRERWRYYAQRGYEMRSHNLADRD